jgi:transcriptional regulator with XRE-family HTH domain
MTKSTQAKFSLPPDVAETISRLGENIRIARKRRAMTLDDMASRMFVTRKTLARLENGDPGVSLAVISSALWVLGLDKGLKHIANPEEDKVGIHNQKQRLPQRVHPKKPKLDLDF